MPSFWWCWRDAVLSVTSAVWPSHTNVQQRRNTPASAVQKWDIGSFRIPKIGKAVEKPASGKRMLRVPPEVHSAALASLLQ